MKIILYTLLFVQFSTILAQNSKFELIQYNNVKAWTSNSGAMFQHPENVAEGGFILSPMDQEDEISMMYTAGVNITGKVGNKIIGCLNTYGHIYRANVEQNYLPGPIETGANLNPAFNKIWKVRYWEIAALNDDFNDNNQIDKKPSDNILSWPGRGNPYSKLYNGINWQERNFAPFYDRNKDGKYNPYDGDCPVIMDDCPQKIPNVMTWSLFHDIESKIEVQTLSYGFSSKTDPILNTTIFSRHTITSFNEKLNEAKFGLFLDMDIGCYSDDYIGTSVEKNSVYGYNITEKDFAPCYSNLGLSKSFKGAPPSQSVTCLNKKMSGSMCYELWPFSYKREPAENEDFYNYFNHTWLDGTPLTYGGDGYNPGSTNKTKFIYPDSPTKTNGWNMFNCNQPVHQTRAFMIFDLGTLMRNQPVTLEFAYSSHTPDMSTDHLSRVDTMINNIDNIVKLYNDCFDTGKDKENCTTDCVWPGDTDMNGIVNNLDILNIGPVLKTNGFKRTELADYWSPFFGNQWVGTNPQMVNLKHIDCNGSGTINKDDYESVRNNFFSTNYRYSSWGGYNTIGNDLSFSTITDSLKGGEDFSIDMIFAENNNISIFGMAYSVEFDPKYLTLTNAVFEKKWLDKKSPPDFVSKNQEGKLHFGIVKNLGSNTVVNNAKIGTLSFRVNEDFKGEYKTLLKYSNYAKVDSDGKISEITSSERGLVVSNPDEEQNEKIETLLYPNPTIEFVFIKSKKNFVNAELFDVLGVKYECQVENNSFRAIDIPTGAYMVRLTDDEGQRQMERLVIIK